MAFTVCYQVWDSVSAEERQGDLEFQQEHVQKMVERTAGTAQAVDELRVATKLMEDKSADVQRSVQVCSQRLLNQDPNLYVFGRK